VCKFIIFDKSFSNDIFYLTQCLFSEYEEFSDRAELEQVELESDEYDFDEVRDYDDVI
jgi:hypothetical protein